MPVDPPSQPLAALVDEQRARREAMFASGGPINHLYPPDKGWVRLDPSTRFASVSLVDLALLVDNPASLAAMLLRLTDDQDSADFAARCAVAEVQRRRDALCRARSERRAGHVLAPRARRARSGPGPAPEPAAAHDPSGPPRRPDGGRSPARLPGSRSGRFAVPPARPRDSGAGGRDDRAGQAGSVARAPQRGAAAHPRAAADPRRPRPRDQPGCSRPQADGD